MEVTAETLKVKDLIFTEENNFSDECGESTLYACKLPDSMGRITILDRMTGFGYRDIESGFKDSKGKFWLASGNFDIRREITLSIEDAIDCIKGNANTCVGS